MSMLIGNKVTVDGDGRILLFGHELYQQDAIKLAESLLHAVRESTDRNQRDTPAYYDSKQIIRRMESPLGQAISAIRKI